jgi:hypothetical protein
MNAVATRTVTTKDTGEEIPGALVLTNYHMNDGYDWMDDISVHGWTAIPNWGTDGWDAGQWPYVIIAVTRTADATGELFGVATYCEGDVSCSYYRTQKAQWEEITRHVFFSWKNGQADGPDDLPETAAELPDGNRAPYPGWTD